jgi:hypothetical protein
MLLFFGALLISAAIALEIELLQQRQHSSRDTFSGSPFHGSSYAGIEALR